MVRDAYHILCKVHPLSVYLLTMLAFKILITMTIIVLSTYAIFTDEWMVFTYNFQTVMQLSVSETDTSFRDAL